ncbi:hypothetical protein F444_22289 [Phytophthora nicotianae P1976]|uniref:BED-type domain-containing protein n=1 Tax=Phytophthora nicotianae P1976 TaxID=1317066 RepID=A0A080YY80_PHYNI|nr:hypothetical protein F444_22289 [Phytophthora nicotianae P1976]
MVSNKQRSEYFFAPEAPGLLKCRYCGKLRNQAVRNGFPNLVSYLTDKHPQLEEDYKEY